MTDQNLAHPLSRRQLLQRGLFGTTLLGIAASSAALSGCAGKMRPPPVYPDTPSVYTFLRRDDVLLVSAIAPAIIAKHWPETDTQQARDALLTRVDLFITRMGDHNIREIRKLFDLLNQTLTRGLTTGIWSSWESVDVARAREFLDDWKNSRLSLLNSAYNALTDIIGFAWYSNPHNTQHLGYAGPPAHLYEVLPQLQERQI